MAMNNIKECLSKVDSSSIFVKYVNHRTYKINNGIDFEKLRNYKFYSFETSLPVTSTKNFLRDKINNFVVWYEEITGMDEVRFMQNRVIEAQDKLIDAQEKRLGATKSLNDIQNKLKDLRSELDTTTKGEERYLQLITQEHALLKEERNNAAKFQFCEKVERDCFSHLSSSVKESHEKERAQAKRSQYWSIIGSVIGTLIGVIGSSINNEFKMRELRNLMKKNNEFDASLVRREDLEILASNIKAALKVTNLNNDVIDEIVAQRLNDTLQGTTVEHLPVYKQEMKITICLAVIVPVICFIIGKFS